MGKSDEVVASTIVAVAVLYKGQFYGLPPSKAFSIYHTAEAEYERVLGGINDIKGGNGKFERILVTAFLLCLFEFINYEMVPSL